MNKKSFTFLNTILLKQGFIYVLFLFIAIYLMTVLLLLMNEQRKSPDRLQLLTSAGERLD